MVIALGAIIVSATGAFFSDSETSSGNTFTAGAIDLTIDSVAHYNGMVCAETAVDSDQYVWVPEDGGFELDENNHPVATEDFNEQSEWDAFNEANPAQYPQAGVSCTGTWPLSDLDDPNLLSLGAFWNFGDIKPGDNGENTISLHIDSNDAWMCAGLANVGGEDLESSATEPELDAGDNTFGSTVADSELDENLHFFAWLDDGDNIYEPGQPVSSTTDAVEVAFGDAVSASELVDGTWTLADSTTPDGPVLGGSTHYIGVAWCAGTIDTNGGAGPITCDGSSMGNIAQTDSWFTDLVFYVEQSRNNSDFVCGDIVDPDRTTLTVTKIVTNDDGGTAVIEDFTLSVDGGVGSVTSGEANDVTPGTYNVSEVGVAGYSATFGGACDENGNVTIAEGENLECTITNDDIPATITLIKEVINDNGGSATSTDFTLRVNGVVVPSGGSIQVDANTEHVIDEDALAGYTFTGITGSGECPVALGASTSPLALDQSITCTITNDDNNT